MPDGRPIRNRSNEWSEYHANLLYKIAIQVRDFFYRAYGLRLDVEDLVTVAWLKIARYRDETQIRKHSGYMRKVMLKRGYHILQERGELPDVGPEAQSIDEFCREGESLSEAQMEERFVMPDLAAMENWELVFKLLRGVCNRRYAMIALQYYLMNRTLEQIGEKMGITRERVRQILMEFQERAVAYIQKHGWNEG